MGESFQRIGVVGKGDSERLEAPLRRLLNFLHNRGKTVWLDEAAARTLGQAADAVSLAERGTQSDLVVVLGGDGTLLNATRALAPSGIPLVGINLGQLGFLTDIPAHDMERCLGQILEGQYHEESRTLLDSRLVRRGETVTQALALNDVVLSKGARGSMIELEVFVDGDFVYNLRADGLIIATPTGSTAYALSSGGPILHPDLAAMVLTPICPHTLSHRPIALSDRCAVEVVLHRGASAFVSFDVQDQVSLEPGDRIQISCAPFPVRLLHPPGYGYFAMLREKLRWGTRL